MQIIQHTVKTSLPIIQIKADTIIFEEGWDDYKMFFVLEGRVKLFNERDDKEIEVAIVKRHEFFGEIEMYSNQPRTSSAKMITDVKLVVIRTPVELEMFMNENNWLTGKVMETMSERLAIATESMIRKTSSTFEAPTSPVVEVSKDNTIRRIIRS